jgi:hypothetical protein
MGGDEITMGERYQDPQQEAERCWVRVGLLARYAELVKAVFDTDAASEVIASGQGAEVNRRIADRFQPEAFYAFAEDGQRTVLMVFDLAAVANTGAYWAYVSAREG